MLKKRRHYFFVTDRRQRHRIEEGDIVEARVVATARAAIVVEVCGVEAPIKVADLDWARIQDAKLAFTVGDRVMCKVMNIEKNSKESTVHLALSRKETIENPYIIAMQDYNEGCKYVGTVSMVSPSGVFVHLAAGVENSTRAASTAQRSARRSSRRGKRSGRTISSPAIISSKSRSNANDLSEESRPRHALSEGTQRTGGYQKTDGRG